MTSSTVWLFQDKKTLYFQNKLVGLGWRPPTSTWKPCQEDLVGIGVWPPISTWITPLPLGSNGLPLCWVPPSSEEIYVEFGSKWATCLGAGATLLWQPNKVESSTGECPWPMYLLSDQCIHVPFSHGWDLLVSIVLWSSRCPIKMENMAERGPH